MPSPPPHLDCSPEAQEERLRRLAELRAVRDFPWASVSDRSRSAAIRNHAELAAAIRAVEDEFGRCAGWRPPSRLAYVPLVKGL